MNFRITFVLAVLAVVVGGYVVLFELQKTSERETQPLWFYNVRDDDVQRISVTHQGETEAFIKGTDEAFEWFFDDGTGTEVDLIRWGGIPLLVTGPRSSRVLEERIDNPLAYGLEPPQTVVGVSLEDGRLISVHLGDVTPDGTGHYAQMVGFPTLFIVNVGWGEVLNRLVTEPPIPPPPDPPQSLEQVAG